MIDPKTQTPARPGHGSAAIPRLLFVADAAVADVDELPSSVRSVIDSAAELYVLTPTLPGRLAWLADAVDQPRHLADERLDTVLGHMRSIDARARGLAGRGSVLTVIADAVDAFKPDHILLALRSAEHANWQERRLIERIEQRFGLPVTSYAVDLRGHTSTADGPLLLCYDGSDGAAHAIQRAGSLFAGRDAIVLTVWYPTALGSLAWAGATESMVAFPEVDRAAVEGAGHIAEGGVRIAHDVGLNARPLAVEASGPVWEAIVQVAELHDVSAIVMGSRGLAGLRSMLLGSVSNAVTQHARQPMLVTPRPLTDA